MDTLNDEKTTRRKQQQHYAYIQLNSEELVLFTFKTHICFNELQMYVFRTSNMFSHKNKKNPQVLFNVFIVNLVTDYA